MPAPSHTAVPTDPLNRAMLAARAWRHLVLVGPSGAGKTTVAPLVASKLGMASADLDALVERRAKKTIAQIFESIGEAGFRRLELAALAQLLRRKTPTVIALGGGTWHQPRARAWLKSVAQEVLLDVPWETACARLGDPGALTARPKLSTIDPYEALRQLMLLRAPSHALCRIVVPTMQATPQDVAERVVAACAQHTPDVLTAQHKASSYSIHFSADGPTQLAQMLARHSNARAVALIADAHVHALYGAPYEAVLAALGLRLHVFLVPPGEAHKTMAQVQLLLGGLSAAGMGRGDVVVGLGGGMVLDVAAFVAGIYVRGVAYCGVATTSLAAVDASVGGKCGVNLGTTKNQVGLIRAPSGVIVDVAAVLAQGRQARAEGAIEALKMGALFAPALMGHVAALDMGPGAPIMPWQQVMAQAVALKIAVCRADPDEKNLRAALNYGHTVGHAIESGSGWRMGHGQAVALGMVAEAEFADGLGLSCGVAAALTQSLRAMNMPADWRRATVEVTALKRDKKGDGHTVVLPVVTTLGQVALHTIPIAQLIDFVRSP